MFFDLILLNIGVISYACHLGISHPASVGTSNVKAADTFAAQRPSSLVAGQASAASAALPAPASVATSPASPSIVVTGYGTSGQETAKTLEESVHQLGGTITWNQATTQFTIQFPADKQPTSEQRAGLFDFKQYHGWCPRVVSEYESGVWIVGLFMKPSDLLSQPNLGIAPENRDFNYWSDFTKSVMMHAKRFLDIGSGNGVATKMMNDFFKPEMMHALEPGSEGGLDRAVRGLEGSAIPLVRMTLQNAVQAADFVQYDVVTVLKYNVDLLEQEEFLNALAKSVTSDGVVVITSVERERVILTKYNESLFLLDLLRTRFNYVDYELVRYSGIGAEYVVICKQPKKYSS